MLILSDPPICHPKSQQQQTRKNLIMTLPPNNNLDDQDKQQVKRTRPLAINHAEAFHRLTARRAALQRG